MASVFVYGTLMPGQPRWPFLSEFVVAQPVPDSITGRLLDTGCGYPGLIDGRGSVHGWSVDLDPRRVTRALEVLDAIEGTEVGLYRRIRVRTRSGVDCWTYLYLDDSEGLRDLRGRWPNGHLCAGVHA